MKDIVITNDCISCGMCSLESEIFIELDNGKAEVNKNIDLNEKRLKEAEQIASECPAKAIKFAEKKGVVKAKGQEGIKELVELMKKELVDTKITAPKPEDYKFNKSEYPVPIAYGLGEYNYVYRNERKAEQAGLKEFDRVMYSQRKAIIQKILVDYKYNKLKKYYEYSNKSGNYYYDVNKKIEEVLIKVYKEAQRITGDKNILPKSFTNFKVIPDFGCDDVMVYHLKHIEKTTTVNDIMNELESLSWYEIYINTGDMEDYNGRDIYCYKDIYKVCKLFGGHILDEVAFVLNSYDGAESMVKDSLSQFTKKINEEVKARLDLLVNCTNKISRKKNNNDKLNSTSTKKVSIPNNSNLNTKSTKKTSSQNTKKYDSRGFDKKGIHRNGTRYDDNGYDKNGFDINGYRKNGSKYDVLGYDREGYNREGYNKNGYNMFGYKKSKVVSRYDENGFDMKGIHRLTLTKYNEYGFNKSGIHKNGKLYDENGFNIKGIHRNGTLYNDEGYDKDGFNKSGIHRNGKM